MKYSSSQINAMSWKEWAEAMANELNKAGYTMNSISIAKDGTLGNVKAPYKVLDDPKYFLLGSVEKAEEITYLKRLGLLNNGRCPMCGNPIKGNPGRFTSGYDYNYHFQVCQNCVQRRNGTPTKSTNSQGCMIALALLPWSIVKYIFHLF